MRCNRCSLRPSKVTPPPLNFDDHQIADDLKAGESMDFGLVTSIATSADDFGVLGANIEIAIDLGTL